MGDIAKFYQNKRNRFDEITVAKPSRTWDPDSRSVFLVTTAQAAASFGGRAGVAVAMSVDRAAESLCDLFGAWRLSTIEDTLEGGAIWEHFRSQREALAARNLEIANNGDGNPSNPRRTEKSLPKHLKESA